MKKLIFLLLIKVFFAGFVFGAAGLFSGEVFCVDAETEKEKRLPFYSISDIGFEYISDEEHYELNLLNETHYCSELSLYLHLPNRNEKN